MGEVGRGAMNVDLSGIPKGLRGEALRKFLLAEQLFRLGKLKENFESEFARFWTPELLKEMNEHVRQCEDTILLLRALGPLEIKELEETERAAFCEAVAMLTPFTAQEITPIYDLLRQWGDYSPREMADFLNAMSAFGAIRAETVLSILKEVRKRP